MHALSIDPSDGTEREMDVESLRQKSRITYVRARDGRDERTDGRTDNPRAPRAKRMRKGGREKKRRENER